MPRTPVRTRMRLESLEARENPSAALATPSAALSWLDWSTTPAAAFQSSAPQGAGHAEVLGSDSALSTAAARTWTACPTADADVSASVYLDGLIPAQVFARGSGLATASPTYYAVTVARGLHAQLVRVADGTSTTLASIESKQYFSANSNGAWASVHLKVVGDSLQVSVQRLDTNQWLTAAGTWSAAQSVAVQATDGTIAAAGSAGVGRGAGYAGHLKFEGFSVQSLGGPVLPQVTVRASGSNSPGGYSGPVAFLATVSPGSPAPARFDFRLNGALQASTTSGSWTFDTTTVANGPYALTVEAVDAAGHVTATSLAFSVNNAAPAAFPVPAAPQHNPSLRIAELAYSGNPMGSAEATLLKNNVDLVVSNPRYFQAIDAAAPATPQFIYSNLSNLYGDLLSSWLAYARQSGSSPEAAFYHVPQATPFVGSSPSSQPVTWFWSAYLASAAAGGPSTDVTSAARGGNPAGVNFGAAGQALSLGFTDPFRLVNVTVTRPAAAGWGGTWEYATKDATGQVVWKALTVGRDGTASFAHSGSISFDPPADWAATAAATGGPEYYYVRFRVTGGTAATAAVASSLIGDDYVHANGGTAGTIPAFDSSADANGDGYLSDAEYAKRKPGMDARFEYQSRLFYPYYGQMRFVVNPSSPAVQGWAAAYDAQVLKANPLASGLFLDNSTGKLPFAGTPVLESTASYGDDFGKVVAAVHRAVGSKWVVTNVAGGTAASIDPVAKASTAAFEESLLRPLTATWSAVGDVSNAVNRLLNADGTPYVILDSSSAGGSPTDGRTQVATLAYYYMVGDPRRTFLMFYGGDAPSTSWTKHWSPAAAVDVGAPTGAMSVFAAGKDPTNAALAYEVFGRGYANGLVLYKPLSYAQGKGTGTTADATATAVALGGKYYVVAADGTVSKTAVSSLLLRNGEGAILLKA